jgi:thiol-disulfide isomerase/thioredoxin
MKIWILLLMSLPVAAQDSRYLDSLLDASKAETALLVAKYDRLSEAYDSTADKSILDQMSLIQNELHKYDHRPEEIRIHFIKTFPNAKESAIQLGYFVHALPIDSLEGLYNNLTPSIRQSGEGKLVATEIAIRKSTTINSPAPDFTARDINNKLFKLSSLKGQYVLLDFWASWCVPCRKSNPHLIELYNKYHNKGFTVLSIADDKSKDVWKKAVTKDKVGIWHHVQRGNDLNNLFAVYTLPVKILLNKNGIIIARFTGDDDTELEKLLSSLLLPGAGRSPAGRNAIFCDGA